MAIEENIFGNTPEGKEIKKFTLTKDGIEASIINYGGILQKLLVPDQDGKFDDIVLGFDSLEGYLKDDTFQGATVGRYANRINNAVLEIDGKKIQLPKNDDGNHLHGGDNGFHTAVWTPKKISKGKAIGIKLSYLSEDGEENYPGNLKATVTYLLYESKMEILFEAESDQKTPVNMTHHSYFNLTGAKRDILDHELQINSDKYLPVDEELIPTGEKKDVYNTPMDFREQHKIGERIDEVEGGYDHNWILNKSNSKLEKAAQIYEEQSGRIMTLYTTKPGIQFYSGNSLGFSGKNGQYYKDHYGLCLEPQYFPDAPNRDNFPFSFLKPGEKYKQKFIYEFDTKNNK